MIEIHYKPSQERIKMELYMFMYNIHYKFVVAQCETGVVPLSMETKTIETDRVCWNCDDIIELEEHVLLSCQLSDDLTPYLVIYVDYVNIVFVNMSPDQTLIHLLSSNDLVSIILCV